MTFFECALTVLATMGVVGVCSVAYDAWLTRRAFRATVPDLDSDEWPTWLRVVTGALAVAVVCIVAAAWLAAGQPITEPGTTSEAPNVVDFWASGFSLLAKRWLGYLSRHPWILAMAIGLWFARAMTIGAIKEQWPEKLGRPIWATLVLGALDPTIRFTRWLFRALHVPRSWRPPDGAPPDPDSPSAGYKKVTKDVAASYRPPKGRNR